MRVLVELWSVHPIRLIFGGCSCILEVRGVGHRRVPLACAQPFKPMSTLPMSPRRSVLYLPASNARALEKARDLPADTLVLDLEDAVAPAAKPQARQQLVDVFSCGWYEGRETVIRVNAIDSDDIIADLATVLACQPRAMLLPKVSSLDELDRFAALARSAGLDAGVRTWFMIETVAGLTNVQALVNAGRSLTHALECLVVGTNDIAKETGVSMGHDRAYLMPWLMNIVLAGKHGRVTVLDGVWNDFKNMAGYERELAQSVAMGFDGKTLIHPSQIEACNRLFSPDPQAVAQARRIVEAFALPENEKAGVINLNGEMVERLHLDIAQRLLLRADRAEARTA